MTDDKPTFKRGAQVFFRYGRSGAPHYITDGVVLERRWLMVTDDFDLSDDERNQ